MHKNAKQKIEDRKIKIELVSQKYYTNQNQMPTYHLKWEPFSGLLKFWAEYDPWAFYG